MRVGLILLIYSSKLYNLETSRKKYTAQTSICAAIDTIVRYLLLLCLSILFESGNGR